MSSQGGCGWETLKLPLLPRPIEKTVNLLPSHRPATVVGHNRNPSHAPAAW